MPADRLAYGGDVVAVTYDGIPAEDLARALGVPAAVIFTSVGSTMDEAHALGASGARAGTVVLADRQTRGRGRHGREWSSPAARGIWLTLLERPTDPMGLEVLSLRIGLGAARALDQFARAPIRLKWPNDLHVEARKLAGVLVEARWRGPSPDWVAVGVGVNVVAPDDVPSATGLRDGTSRLDVLGALVPALRKACGRIGFLDADELREFAARDLARGRPCTHPARGIVRGVTPAGELIVDEGSVTRHYRAGSLVLQEAP